MKKSITLLILVIILIPLLMNKIKSKGAKEVNAVKPVKAEIRQSILSSGKFEYIKTVKVRTEITGIVDNIKVKQGQKVSTGQLLFVINDKDFIVEVTKFSARLKRADLAIAGSIIRVKRLQLKFDKFNKLVNKNVVTQESLNDIKLELELANNDLLLNKEIKTEAQTLLNQAKDNLNKTNIYSPIDGIILNLVIKEGEVVNGNSIYSHGSVVMKVADPNSLLARLYIDESNILKINTGQEVELQTLAIADHKLKGKVNFVYNELATDSARKGRNFAIDVKVTDIKNYKLKEGMSCHAEIFTGSSNKQIVINQASLRYETNENINKSYVFIIKNDQIKKVYVTTSISDDNLIAVETGINSDDLVITGPQKLFSSFKDGDQVIFHD